MAKINKKNKKKKLVLRRFTAVFCIFSFTAYLCSALFLRTINNNLSSRTQEIQAQIAEVQTQNDAVEVVIQTLSSRDRVDSIAEENGLSLNQDNIVTITATSGE